MSQVNTADLRKRAPLVISLGIVILLGVILVAASGFYTDVLWFDQLGYLSVLTTQLWAQVWVFLAASLFGGLLVWLNLFLAWRFRPVYATSNDFFGRDLGEFRAALDKARRRMFTIIKMIVYRTICNNVKDSPCVTGNIGIPTFA